jgi:hypothetical protein
VPNTEDGMCLPSLLLPLPVLCHGEAGGGCL